MGSGELWGLRLDGGKIVHHASLVIYTRGLNLGLHMLGEEGRDIGGILGFLVSDWRLGAQVWPLCESFPTSLHHSHSFLALSSIKAWTRDELNTLLTQASQLCPKCLTAHDLGSLCMGASQ
jgi:hypothetical protein